ncbi:MAG: hypothetical protein U0527_08855 [Candidatus Eisenbacteria bacterium]
MPGRRMVPYVTGGVGSSLWSRSGTGRQPRRRQPPLLEQADRHALGVPRLSLSQRGRTPRRLNNLEFSLGTSFPALTLGEHDGSNRWHPSIGTRSVLLAGCGWTRRRCPSPRAPAYPWHLPPPALKAEDASLAHVENDEDLAAGGVSPRWGYLFRSVSRASCRVYSVEGRSLDGGSIEVAEDLALRLTAPPLPAAWIDSPAALEAAEAELGEQLREAGTSLATMALVRSALRDDRPDATYWLCVYGASGAPSFFVLVDAVSGKVARTWRG